LTGLYAAVAVLACIRAREKSGHGYAIDLALLDCAVAAQVNVAQAYLTGGSVPPRQGNAHLQIVPYQLFATADAWIVLAVGNDGQWQRFCQAAGEEDFAIDARFATNAQRVANRNILVPMLEKVLRKRMTWEWEELLARANVPQAAIWDYASLFSHPQANQRGLRVTVRDPEGRPVDLLQTPFHIAGTNLIPPTAPPALGAQTDSVLERLLEMDGSTLDDLRSRGVI
jgi:crotonobetainyl-CoA:carnitine CoA-transferase CaiB-like acyl-CoA transferase